MNITTVLNNVDHKHIKIDTRPNHHLNVNRSLIYATEISELHKEFPIVFNKHQDNQQIQLHVILGLDKDENLFVDENGWTTRFIPALLARGPFSLGYKKSLTEENTKQDPVICIDMEDSRVNTEHGEDLFLPLGGESSYLDFIDIV